LAKTHCPDDITVEEREDLLAQAVPVSEKDPCARRYAMRRGEHGIELFDAKLTQLDDGEPEFHGHPATFVPANVLRRFREEGRIEGSEYRRLVKRFGCP